MSGSKKGIFPESDSEDEGFRPQMMSRGLDESDDIRHISDEEGNEEGKRPETLDLGAQ